MMVIKLTFQEKIYNDCHLKLHYQITIKTEKQINVDCDVSLSVSGKEKRQHSLIFKDYVKLVDLSDDRFRHCVKSNTLRSLNSRITCGFVCYGF